MPDTPPTEPHFFEQRLSLVLAMLDATTNEVRAVLDHFREDGPEDAPDDDHQPGGGA